MASVSFKAAFPDGAKGLRGGSGDAWRVWMDAYPSTEELIKLVTIAKSEVPLKVTVEVDESV